MGAGWRIDNLGVGGVVERGDADARQLISGLGSVSAILEDVNGLLDGVVGAALRRFEERWQESAESLDRRALAVVEAARAVVREHLSTDEDMADDFRSGLSGAEAAGSRFAPRIPQ